MNPDKVLADMVDASSFPELSEQFRISSVPATVANAQGQVVGAVPEGRLLAMVQKTLH
ncbi:MAG: thioredoxin family protein [Firmicutes bacterium]|nr:thioredoxin family protein [Bacillota bacterium]